MIELNITFKKVKHRVKFSYKLIVSTIIIVWVITFIIAPEQKLFYRTIIGIGDINYTAMETSYIISKYDTTLIKKGAMVLGNYLFNFLRLVVPAILIIETSHYIHKTKFNLMIGLLISATQFLVVDGAIARSIFCFVTLILLTIYVNEVNIFKFVSISILFGGITVIFYFLIRYRANSDSYKNVFVYLSRISNSYFSGVTNVAAVFNLPRTFEFRLHYFIYDILKAIPFSNTIFRLNNNTFTLIFGQYNTVTGQIPPTIGSGYYYFGYILSPLYSVLFAITAYKSSAKLNLNINSIKMLSCIFMSIMMPLGIVMYNQSILFTNIFAIILPMIIVENIAYKKTGRI